MTGTSSGWWLEDAVPGTTIRHPGGRTIGEAEHVWLAWVTHNVSDIHGDAAAALRNEWGQPLVLGLITVAITIGLAAPATPPPELAVQVAMAGWRSIRLVHPVVPGDTLRAESSIVAVAVDAASRRGRVQRTIRGYDQRGNAVAIIDEERDVPCRPRSTWCD